MEQNAFCGAELFPACSYLLYVLFSTVGCSELPEVAKSSVERPIHKYAVGAYVRFSCAPGYVLFGNPIVQCTSSGKFSKPRFFCLGKACLKRVRLVAICSKTLHFIYHMPKVDKIKNF